MMPVKKEKKTGEIIPKIIHGEKYVNPSQITRDEYSVQFIVKSIGYFHVFQL